MPAFILGSTAGSRYSAVGCRGAHGIRHVALLARDQQLSPACSCEVFHAHPPLWIGQGVRSQGDNSFRWLNPSHVVGWPKELSNVIDKLDIELASLRKQIPEWSPLSNELTGLENTYTIHPPFVIVEGEDSEMHFRFSCVGFVLYCYEILCGLARLLPEDDGAYPLLSLDDLRPVFGRPLIDRLRDDADLRRVLGLGDDGPWPIRLPGYLFHALAAPDSQLPITPRAEYANFSISQKSAGEE